MGTLPDLPVQQLAYAVDDIETAARAHSAAFGSGPYFILRHVPLSKSVHRGVERAFDHSSAYGQWGEVMLEFVQVHSEQPNAISDLFPDRAAASGLHHTAVFVDDLAAGIAQFEDAGMPLAQLCETTTGTRFAFMDATASLGHMIELYEPDDAIRGFYAMVREASQEWDGSEPLRELGE